MEIIPRRGGAQSSPDSYDGTSSRRHAVVVEDRLLDDLGPHVSGSGDTQQHKITVPEVYRVVLFVDRLVEQGDGVAASNTIASVSTMRIGPRPRERVLAFALRLLLLSKTAEHRILSDPAPPSPSRSPRELHGAPLKVMV